MRVSEIVKCAIADAYNDYVGFRRGLQWIPELKDIDYMYDSAFVTLEAISFRKNNYERIESLQFKFGSDLVPP